jgi:hypothetical protein
MKAKTRQELIEEMNGRIFSKINSLMAALADDKLEYETAVNGIVKEELEDKDTTSDEWLDFAERLEDLEHKALAYKVAQAVLVRNGCCDGLPFCPLCGKLGTPKHNGAPLIEAQVCEACNNRKVIPARIRAAQQEAK